MTETLYAFPQKIQLDWNILQMKEKVGHAYITIRKQANSAL